MQIAKRPYIVVDVGGTIINRSRPGTVQRVVDCLKSLGINVSSQAHRLAVASIVLTSPDPESAAGALVEFLRLPQAFGEIIHASLIEPDGDAFLFDHALDLLSAARSYGWGVVAATNAVRWITPLPLEISDRCDSIVSSGDLGIIKQDLRFWSALRERVGLDPAFTLVVGDEPDADVISARRGAYAALKVDHREVTLSMIRSAIEQAGPMPSDADGIAAGVEYRWAGRWVIDVPNLIILLTRVTRARVEIQTTAGTRFGEVVRRRDDSPVLVAAEGRKDLPSISWVRVRADRRMAVIPQDLALALADAGVSISALTIGEQRLMIGMVREAREPLVRKRRIADIVEHLKPRSQQYDT